MSQPPTLDAEYQHSRLPDQSASSHSAVYARPPNLDTHRTPEHPLPPSPTTARRKSLSSHSNRPVHQAALLSAQHIHGNRALQRKLNASTTPGHVAIQRTPTETLETMRKIMGEGPGFEYIRGQMGMEPGQAMHTLESLRKFGMEDPGLDYMARQMGMYGVEGKPNGPYATGGENEAGGYEMRFRANGDKSGWADSDAGFGEGAIGAWDEEGGRQYGIKGKVGLVRGKINDGGYVSGDWEAGTAGAEFSYGENGIRAQMGATGIGGGVTVGTIDKENDTDTQLHVGVSAGPSIGLRVHTGDSDHDGIPEIGAGVDIGPLSLDSKSERAMAMNMAVAERYWDMYDTLADGSTDDVARVVGDPLGSAMSYFNNSDGPSEAQQQKNQADFIAKKDKELADIEKNKEKIMKEQGPQAYYHKMTLANLPPQLRNLVEAAP